MDKFRVFVDMLMRDASLKQRIPCIIRISIFGAFSAEKSAHYTRVNTVCTKLNDLAFHIFNSKYLDHFKKLFNISTLSRLLDSWNKKFNIAHLY